MPTMPTAAVISPLVLAVTLGGTFGTFGAGLDA